MRPKVAVDVDGVIRNFRQAIHDTLIERGVIKPNCLFDITQWCVYESYLVEDAFVGVISREEFYNKMYTIWAENIFLKAKPYQGAGEFMQELEDRYSTVGILTDQKLDSWFYTLSWLSFFFEDYRLHCDYIICSKDKHLFVGPDKLFNIIIDDKAITVADVVKGGGEGILFMRPWNREIPMDDIECSQVYNYTDALGALRELECRDV